MDSSSCGQFSMDISIIGMHDAKLDVLAFETLGKSKYIHESFDEGKVHCDSFLHSTSALPHTYCNYIVDNCIIESNLI